MENLDEPFPLLRDFRLSRLGGGDGSVCVVVARHVFGFVRFVHSSLLREVVFEHTTQHCHHYEYRTARGCKEKCPFRR